MIFIEPKKVSFQNNFIKKLVMVCSHERSGTHFLINSISLNTIYTNEPFLNFDYKFLGSFVNFNDTYSINKFFGYLKNNYCSSIIKNHFEYEFFKNIITDEVKIIYIYRNPVDMFLSYKRFVDFLSVEGVHWGPKCENVAEFIMSEPEGSMTRYQWKQSKSLLHRWEKNIHSWSSEVHYVCYEDLNTNFEETMKGILEYIGVPVPETFKRPPDNIQNTVFIPGKIVISDDERKELMDLILSNLTIDNVRNLVYNKYHA